MSIPGQPSLHPGDVVRVGGQRREISMRPIWVRDRWRVLTRGEGAADVARDGVEARDEVFEQYVDCDQVEALP